MSNISSIGRFSSQMLTYLGTQKTVKAVTDSSANTFKYSDSPTIFPSPDSISQAALGYGVTGAYSLADYNSTKCYFLSRGATQVYAETMTGLAIDIASSLGISTQELLMSFGSNGQVAFTDNAYRVFNLLRDPGNQVGTVTSVDNRNSLQSKQIRS